MPLKHAIETKLVVVLAAVMLLTGFMASTLPPFPQAVIPWCILLALTIMYPVLLYPLFKRDRADNSFRLLHWFPAILLGLWMLLELVRLYIKPLALVSEGLRWGWMLPLLLVGIVALIGFCLQVIRRRERRISLILLLLLPFAALAAYSERGGNLEQIVGSALWQFDGSALIANLGSGNKDDKNLDPSIDPKEEEWRASLRAMEKRERELEELRQQGSSISSQNSSDNGVIVVAQSSIGSIEGTSSSASSVSSQEVLPDALQPGGTGTHLREVKNGPTALPQSGFGWGLILLSMTAGYCAVLHDRARRRA